MKEYDQVQLIIALIGRWHGMRRRCGKREVYTKNGITVCDEWQTTEGIEPFVRWGLANGFHPSLVLDRVDNNKGYSPDNCRWATPKENANNARHNVLIEYKNKKYTLSQFSELPECRVPYYLVKTRHHQGWTPEEILRLNIHYGNAWIRGARKKVNVC